MIKEGSWHILTNKRKFPEDIKEKKHDGNWDVITLFYGFRMRKACSVLHLALKKQIALAKWMPWVGITIQQCCEQIHSRPQSKKGRRWLRQKALLGHSETWVLARTQTAQQPSLYASIYLNNSLNWGLCYRQCLSQLCSSFIPSKTFYWAPHCIPGTALGTCGSKAWNKIK